MGRQARHQEGGQGPARAFVSPECPVVRDPGPHRSRGTGEDRSDRSEPQEAQDVRVGFRAARSARTPFSVPTRTVSAILRKRPWPTTPGMLMIWVAVFAGEGRERKRASTMWFPLSVRKISPSLRRSTYDAPRVYKASAAKRQPNGWTSTGTGAFDPRRDTSLDSSTITTNFLDAAATIFSRSSAPPNPLMRSSFGSTSSAPSTQRSGGVRSSSDVSGIPSSFATSAVAKDVGTPLRSMPLWTSRATPSRKCRAVEPVPRPRTMPGFTKASAASAAFRFWSSEEANSRPPPEFFDQFHQAVDHEVVQFLSERLGGFRRSSRDPGPILRRVVDDRVRRNPILPRGGASFHEVRIRRQDAGRLTGARMAVSFWKDPFRGVDQVVVGEDRRLQSRLPVHDLLGRRTEGHHVFPALITPHDHHAADAVPHEVIEDIADKRLERIDGHAHGARIRPRGRADTIGNVRRDECTGPPGDLVEDMERLDHVRPERQVRTVFLQGTDRDDHDGIRPSHRREFPRGHVGDAHAGESTSGP